MICRSHKGMDQSASLAVAAVVADNNDNAAVAAIQLVVVITLQLTTRMMFHMHSRVLLLG